MILDGFYQDFLLLSIITIGYPVLEVKHMTQLNHFSNQHKRIHQSVNHLEMHLKTEQGLKQMSKATAKDCFVEFHKLSGFIRVHLAMEALLLYPVVQRSQDESAKTKAIQYQTEMDQIVKVFTGFLNKWDLKTIYEYTNIFKDDAQAIIDVLNKRLRAEETEFYPIAQTIGNS